MTARPVHEIRRGLLKVRVHRSRGRSSTRYTISIVRLFRNGDVWKMSSRFSRDDIPVIRLLLDEAFLWIHEQNCGVDLQGKRSGREVRPRPDGNQRP